MKSIIPRSLLVPRHNGNISNGSGIYPFVAGYVAGKILAWNSN